MPQRSGPSSFGSFLMSKRQAAQVTQAKTYQHLVDHIIYTFKQAFEYLIDQCKVPGMDADVREALPVVLEQIKRNHEILTHNPKLFYALFAYTTKVDPSLKDLVERYTTEFYRVIDSIPERALAETTAFDALFRHIRGEIPYIFDTGALCAYIRFITWICDRTKIFCEDEAERDKIVSSVGDELVRAAFYVEGDRAFFAKSTAEEVHCMQTFMMKVTSLDKHLLSYSRLRAWLREVGGHEGVSLKDTSAPLWPAFFEHMHSLIRE